MKLHYNGKSTANGLKIYNRANFDKDVLMFLDKEITITVERKKRNGVYHRTIIISGLSFHLLEWD